MLIRKKNFLNIKENSVTDKSKYLKRRDFVIGFIGASLFPMSSLIGNTYNKNNQFNIAERSITSFKKLTRYNNFFEFGTSKQIWKAAQKLVTDPWKIKVVKSENQENYIDYEELVKKFDLEERIYKFRCVEAWSMIVPWYGFQLSELIDYLQPSQDIKFVSFKTFYNPKIAPNQKQKWYPWPYKEIITVEEARNKLAFIATGIYGEDLPKQNGAPLRLVLPWKYGFKSIKSISEIEFLRNREKSFWETIAPNEYGFWANVNPKYPHRRWSQEYETDIGNGNKYPTKIFNGYEKWVSHLYKDLDEKSLFY